MKSIIMIILLLILTMGNINAQGQLKYDRSILDISKINSKKIPLNFENNELAFNIGLPFLDSKCESTVKIEEIQENLINQDHFLYGWKTIFDNLSIVIYSNEINPWTQNENIFYEKREGYLIVQNDEQIICAIKIYSNQIDDENLLTSFLFENYLIVTEQNDYNYDIYSISKKTNHLKYAVIEISKNGFLNVLEEKKAISLITKKFSENKIFSEYLK